VRASGLSVAAKFSLATSAVVAVSMVVFTVVLYTVVSSSLSGEIDEAGISAVRAMVATDVSAWKEYEGTVVEGQEETAGETGQVTLPRGADAEVFRTRRDYNRTRARRIAAAAGTKILDAAVLDPSRKKVLNGSGISFQSHGNDRRVGEVQISEGLYRGSQRETRARTYTAPFRDSADRVRGYAILALSEEKIQKTLTKLLLMMGALTLLFIGVGLLSSWLLAQRITQPVAILTQDMESVAKGDLEHRTRAHSTDEIGVLARTFDHMTQSLLAAQGLERDQAAQAHQLELARQVQDALVPDELPAVSDYECASYSRQTENVTSVFYDVLPLDDGDTLLVLVSSSGAGIPGAMVVIMARSLLKALAPVERSPAELLRKVNAKLAPDLRRGMYVTALVARINKGGENVVLANAGHHPLLVCQKGAEEAEPFHSDGIALGFDKGPVFDRTIKDTELQVEPGMRLVMCTRSMFSLRSKEGKEVGERPVYKLLARESPKNSAAFVPLVGHKLDALQVGEEGEGGVAFLTLKRIT
jgi:serine phosphatase RsbU (regulator of sigma subunit)